jgi:hypothetical protein
VKLSRDTLKAGKRAPDRVEYAALQGDHIQYILTKKIHEINIAKLDSVLEIIL